MKADVIIIGSGVSGLTAAAILAKKNSKIVIVESHRNPGGALKRFKREGIPFDVGFHYTGCLGEGDILRCLWEYIGVLPKIEVNHFSEEGCDLLKIRDSSHVVHSYFSYERLEEELISHFPDETNGILKYFQTIREVSSTIPFYNLDLPLTPFLRSFFDHGQNLGQFIHGITLNPVLQAVLASPAFLYGVPPVDAGVAVHASVSHGFYSGVSSVKGGGQAIVDAYLEVLNNYDVTIHTSSAVTSIKTETGRVKGVFAGDKYIEAPTVIYTGHPSCLLDIISENVFKPAYRHRLQDLKNTDSMFVVFGTTDSRKLAEELRWKNFYSIKSGFNLLDADTINPGNNSVLVTAPGLRDFDLGLRKKSFPVILMRPARWEETLGLTSGMGGVRSERYLEWKSQSCSQLISSAAEEFCFSAADITTLASGSPLTFSDELKSPQGAVYGPQFCLGQYNPSARTKLNGLYLAGQGTLMPGIVSAALSGLVAAGETEEIETLWEEVRTYR